jgi:hypothetical protein
MNNYVNLQLNLEKINWNLAYPIRTVKEIRRTFKPGDHFIIQNLICNVSFSEFLILIYSG